MRSLTIARSIRGLATVAAAAAIVATAGCGDSEVLSGDAFRNAVPANAELVDEFVDDGSSITIDGERTVLRTFAPTPPADTSDVLEALIAEGENDGWRFTDRSTSRAVGTKEIDGQPWSVSVSINAEAVHQLFAGR
jgi:hypothetical protein